MFADIPVLSQVTFSIRFMYAYHFKSCFITLNSNFIGVSAYLHITIFSVLCILFM